MGWRLKLAGLLAVGAGLGGAIWHFGKQGVRAVGEADFAPYSETVAFRLEEGSPVELQVLRCDLGRSQQQFILKVYAAVTSLAPGDIPRRSYSFPVVDGAGRTYADRAPEDLPEANTFSLRSGERREFVMKYLLEPLSLQTSLDLVRVENGGRTNRLARLKTADPIEPPQREGEWRVFREARWRP